ncbi:MAG: class I SAM-dependent methyltransferase [Candidatus Zixiibacteriota bacterium]|nr:MAG: class I SAM-dependent methyltransferase [candidate division Zixibacteria bacterium]
MENDRKRYFESFAEEWDKMFTAEELELLDFLIDSFNLPEGARVADLGCGTGVLFDIIRRRIGPGGMLIGIDFCTPMVQKAKLNFPFANVYTVDADVECLPLKKDSFDIAITFAAFAHFIDQKKVMQEVSRILKQKGRFYIVHLLSSEELEEHHHQVGGPVADDHLPNREEMMRLFEEGRFTDVKITDHPGLYLAEAVKE